MPLFVDGRVDREGVKGAFLSSAGIEVGNLLVIFRGASCRRRIRNMSGCFFVQKNTGVCITGRIKDGK